MYFSFKAQDSGFQKQKFPGFWNPYFLTWAKQFLKSPPLNRRNQFVTDSVLCRDEQLNIFSDVKILHSHQYIFY